MFLRFKTIYPLIFAYLLMGIILIWKLQTLPPQIPLFYSLPTGEDQLADSWTIILLPFIMSVLFVANIFIEKKYFYDIELIRKIFNYLNILIVVSFTLIFIKIILLIS